MDGFTTLKRPYWLEIIPKRLLHTAFATDPGVKERRLKPGNGRAFYPKMGIMPNIKVIVTDVHPAGIGYAAVYDNYLTVLLTVEPHDEKRQALTNGCVADNLNSGFLHGLPEFAWNTPCHKTVKEETDLYSLTGFLYEKVPDLPSRGVISKAEILQMNGMTGIPYILHQKFFLVRA